MEIHVPELALVILIGASSAGKSTFAQRHFQATEIVSSDALRQLVSNDENDQSASGDAFDLLHRMAAMRLKRGLLTVVDATNLHADERRPLLRLARDHYVQTVALVCDLPEQLSQQRNQVRHERDLPPEVIHRHRQQVERTLTRLRNEGFSRVYRFETVEEVDSASVRRIPLAVDLRQHSGPFDIIGDVHGCSNELEELLGLLGYTKAALEPGSPQTAWSPHPFCYTHKNGRRIVFVGDLVDRGPRILDACMLALHSKAAGHALAVPGNHDDKFLRWMRSRQVEIAHGLQSSVDELEAQPPETRPALQEALVRFFDDLPSHLVLDNGRLVVAHAGVRQRMIGREHKRIRDFALYGETHGETDEAGRPIRYNWAANYHGRRASFTGIPWWSRRNGRTWRLTSIRAVFTAAG